MAVKAHCMAVARDPSTGAALLSATINVYNPGTVTPIPATMFDKNGNVLTNPLTSDPTTGLIDFYLVVPQEVDLVVSKAGYTTRTYSNVPVIDDASFDLSAVLTTTGDIVYASSANTPARLAVGATGTFLTVSGGLPSWSNTIAAGGLTITANGLQVTSGNVGVLGSPLSTTGVLVSGSLTGGVTQYGFDANPIFGSGTTTEGSGFVAVPQTAAAAFTCVTVAGFHANNPVKGAGSTITNAYGLLVDSMTTGNTNNYGVYINAPSGGATANVGLNNQGTSALVGAVSLGTGSGPPATGVLIGGATPAGVSGTIALGTTIDSTGGGATATLGTIGGTGPTTAAMNSWLRIRSGTTTAWLPVWI